MLTCLLDRNLPYLVSSWSLSHISGGFKEACLYLRSVLYASICSALDLLWLDLSNDSIFQDIISIPWRQYLGILNLLEPDRLLYGLIRQQENMGV